MDYPRELKLDYETEQRLISYIDDEITTHASERGAWVSDLQAWQEDYWATPSAKEATFPYKGAANLIIPLTAIAVESTHAREMTTLFALEQFVTAKIQDPTMQDLNHDLESAIDRELLKGVDIYKFADETLLENKKLGSCIGKVGYEKIIKTAIRQDPGGVETEFEVITKQGACAYAVPLANFLMPFAAKDPQHSPWVGEEHLENRSVVEDYINSGYFGQPNLMEKMDQYFMNNGSQLSSQQYTNSVRNFQNQQPIQWPMELGWYELWLSFNVDGNKEGKKHELVVHYHRQSRMFFSIRYNWNDNLSRPYRIGNYFPLEHRWAGIGIGKQNEQFQAEVTTQHRQRIDNATLANLRMFKVKQGIGIGPDEPLFPGKIWLLDEMDDVQDLQMAEIYPSSYNNEQQAVIYSQQRSGVNELSLGMPQSGTPGTATSDLTRVQEFNRKFDYTFGNSKRFLLDITKDVLCIQSQFGFRDPRYFQTIGQNGPIIQQLLSQSPDLIRNELLFTLKLVSSVSNRITDRNNYTQYAGMLSQYYTQIVQLAQMGMPQILPIVIVQAIIAATEVMQQISEGFEIRGAERFLLPKQLLASLMAPNGPKTMGALGSGDPSAQGSSEQPGISNPAQPGQNATA